MQGLTPLSRALIERPETIVAVHKDESANMQEFFRRVHGWVRALRDMHALRCAVYHNDAFEFLAILFALWQLKCTACIPGDNRSGTVDRLKQHVDGFAGEFSGDVTCIGNAADDISDMVQYSSIAPDFIALEIYTSGSTGEPKPITKTIYQLEKELSVIESLWPSKRDNVVLTTVSHQHLYGMTFRLFWPFCTGRAFARKLCEYSEDVLHQAKYHSSFSLVSSPSHLSRMNTSVNWQQLAGHCDYVISSAAPLARRDSLNVAGLLHAPVREVYGSSETGAVAWRIQQESETDALWRAFPEVVLTPGEKGTLRVESPYLGDDEFYLLPDRVEFGDKSHFKLMGRVDRIVKVEGKRVSLAEMERLLLESPLIKNARVLTLERKRIETAAVIQLSDTGLSRLSVIGRKLLIKELKGLLLAYFETVVLPRRWRFIEQMPYNAQGKLPMDALQSMFVKESVQLPKITHEHVLDGEAEIQCLIQDDLVYFDGHFEGSPVLPGIVQVHWAEALARRFWAVSGRFKTLEVVKFQKIIVPGYKIDIILKYDAARNKVHFQYVSEKGVHSSGRICFE